MRCVACHRWSLEVICPACRDRLLVPHVRRRTVGTLEVVSLFGYETIEPFLLSKHRPVGYRIYRYFGRRFIAPFLYEFASKLPGDGRIRVIGVDEQVRRGYSHTAGLTRPVRHRLLEVLHGRLIARRQVHYAGKTLRYRLEHPRDFRYTGPAGGDAILVDDIITTGLTLQQAQQTLHANGVNVLFALTLADAQR